MFTKTPITLIVLFTICLSFAKAQQAILPPLLEWQGKSEGLIVKPNNPWITPIEKTNFEYTPSYDETMNWFKKLVATTSYLKMISIGKSPEGRDIMMIVASTDANTDAASLQKSEKPLLFVQAGIHAGEIDGKDAGMMLFRDIALGNKKSLLDNVNFLFIPILNVDGHERSSEFNRPNQRGPKNMGWRTNAQNLNLNRDYSKLDTKEICAVINVINEYNPTLYIDLHVTDGADYQYDVTYSFGGMSKQAYSPASTAWLENTFAPFFNKDLSLMGHIPGPFLNSVNGQDFSKGQEEVIFGPSFSHNYSDLRHLPAILLETHSLKLYKQRVLGMYVTMESTLSILAKHGATLKKCIESDKTKRDAKIALEFKIPAGVTMDNMNLLGVSSQIVKSPITNADYVEWTGKKTTTTIPYYRATEATVYVDRPKGYWIPASCFEVIERLKTHGIKMETLTEAKQVSVQMYRMQEAKYAAQPFEGHIKVNAKPVVEIRKQLFSKGSVYISTNQPLGDLAIVLLEPSSSSSFFSWGFFMEIFQQTEYMEGYILEPMIKDMLEKSPELKKEFEEKKENDKAFAENPNAIRKWFYSKSKYMDERYLLYPVGRDL